MNNRLDFLPLLDLPVGEMRRLGYALVERLIERHLAMPALRFCTINPRTTFGDIQQTIARLEVCGNRL